jgi:hypothetical protein
MLRVSFGYPTPEEEWEVLRRRMSRRQEEAQLPPVVDARTLQAMQAALEDVAVEDSIGRYIVALTAATREHASALVGSSPRGSLALLLLARARASWRAADFVVPEDVKDVAVPALAHRITLRPEMWLRRVDPSFVVQEVLAATAGPGQRRPADVRGRVLRPVTDRAAAAARRRTGRRPAATRRGRRRPGCPPGRSAVPSCSPASAGARRRARPRRPGAARGAVRVGAAIGLRRMPRSGARRGHRRRRGAHRRGRPRRRPRSPSATPTSSRTTSSCSVPGRRRG